MRDEMPDEANRYDGAPARKPPKEGPTQDEMEQAKQEFDASVEFIKEILEDASLSEVVLEDTGYGLQLDVNIEELAKEQGRSEEYTEYFEHTRDHGVQQAVRLAAKKAAGVEFREEDIS